MVSGTWHIGYGDKTDESKLKVLPPGSFYTEPPGRNHFAQMGDEPVAVQIIGVGPSSTEYVDKAQEPRRLAKIKAVTRHVMKVAWEGWEAVEFE